MKFSDHPLLTHLRPLAIGVLMSGLLLNSGCATRQSGASDDSDVPFEERSLPRSADERLSREDFEGPEKEGEASSDSLVDAILKIGFLDKERAAREAEERRQEEARQAELARKEAAQRRAAEEAAEQQRQAQAAEQARQAQRAADAEQAQQDATAAEPEPTPATAAQDITVEERSTATADESAPVAAEPVADLQETPLAPAKPQPLTAQSRKQAREADKAQQYFTLALEQARNGQHEAALSLFRDIAAQYPSLSGPIVNQAIMLRRLNRGDEALALLQGSMVNKVSSHYLLNELGILYREHGRFNQARQAYESAIRREPAYAKAYYNLGVLADLYLHDPALALDAFRQYQSLQTEPDKQVAIWIVEIERRVNR